MQLNSTLHDVITQSRRLFGVEFIDYARAGTGIVVSSGCGIGLAVMDQLPLCRYFVDIDNYRKQTIDWEALFIAVSARKPSAIVLVGWYTIDVPKTISTIERACLSPSYRYDGGGTKNLGEFLADLNLRAFHVL